MTKADDAESNGDRRAVGRVLITWPDYDVEHEDLGGALRAAGLELALHPKLGLRTPGELLAIAHDVVGAIVSTDPFDASVLAACPALRVIARVGVGFDSIDAAAATAQGVTITITPGANDTAVAEHTLALILAAIRRIAEHDREVRSGEWNRTGPHAPYDLAGATVGLVGYGAIGKAVARRLGPFGARVIATDPVQGADEHAEVVPFEQLLRESHVISLHTPLLPSTHKLIGAAEIESMRPDAILVNTARGGVVDEAALVAALGSGRLRGAALDVFEQEPPTSPELLGLPNVVVTPHTGGISGRSVQEMTRRATASVIDVVQGRVPADVANPAVLQRSPFTTDASVT